MKDFGPFDYVPKVPTYSKLLEMKMELLQILPYGKQSHQRVVELALEFEQEALRANISHQEAIYKIYKLLDELQTSRPVYRI
jgi:predicted component of type VI protein secretion system